MALNSSSRFPAVSIVRLVNPVMLPPGRARLSTRPVSTGSVGTVHHNGDGRGCLLGSQDRRLAARHDEVDVEPDEFGRQRWEAGDVPFCVTVF